MKVKMKQIDWVAYVLTTLGAVNWGIIAVLKFDLLETLFTSSPALVFLFRFFIGLAGAYWLYQMPTMKK